MTRTMANVTDVTYTRLVSFAVLLAGDVEMAKDVADEALVRTLSRNARAKEATERDARAAASALYGRRLWRARLARRTTKRLAGEAASQQRRTEAESYARAAVPRAEEMPPPDALRAALALLTPFKRACAVLKYFDDLAPADVAARMGQPGARVRRALEVADAALREHLDADPDVEHVHVVTAPSHGGA